MGVLRLRPWLIMGSYLLTTNSFAIDLGVQGRVFSIEEINIKQKIYQQFSQRHWQDTVHLLVQKTWHWLDHLPTVKLTYAQRTQHQFIDPSIRLSRDIWFNGQCLYKQGDKINPLEYTVPRLSLFFFDATVKQQKAMVHYLLRHGLAERVLFIAVRGNPEKLSARWHHIIFYAFPQLLHRFSI